MTDESTEVSVTRSEADPGQIKPGEGLVFLGVALLIGGAGTAAVSCFMPTSITTAPTFLDGDLTGREIVNVAKLQAQMLVLHIGLAMGISGSVFFAVGRLIRSMRR